MNFSKHLLPARHRQVIKRKLYPLLYAGSKVSCPCCGENFRKFLPFGLYQRQNAQCPGCGSLERHRLLWLYLNNKTDLLSRSLSVFHIAPWYALQRKLKLMPNIKYFTADLNMPEVTIAMDLQFTPFVDNQFDAILCSHVLNHVADDRKAMKELFRILKPGGWALVLAVVDNKLDKTFEDSNAKSPEDRTRVYGFPDYLRRYGRDFKDRLSKAGFGVKVEKYAKDFEYALSRKYGLSRDEDIYLCIKRM